MTGHPSPLYNGRVRRGCVDPGQSGAGGDTPLPRDDACMLAELPASLLPAFLLLCLPLCVLQCCMLLRRACGRNVLFPPGLPLSRTAPRKALLPAVLVLALVSPVAFAEPAAFDPGRAAFSLRAGERVVDYREFAVFLMPGAELSLQVLEPRGAVFALEVGGLSLSDQGRGKWRWRAPEKPGLHVARVRRADGESMTLNLVVMRRASDIRDGYLNGYRMGQYPAEPLRGNPIYLPPKGFIEVTPELASLRVSPNFTLGQFLCKQQPDRWPKYLALREPLLKKLELLLEEVNRRGIHTDTFTVMSGYRTPWYNAAIGNGLYSRHVWGGAADIFIDTVGDGRMDDLNGDGVVDLADAEVLHRIVDELFSSPLPHPLSGGLGLYGPRPHRGPFVHVDARGHEARWAMP